MAEANGVAITVSEMHVADPFASLTQGAGNGGLFDIHVIKVRENFYAFGFQGSQKGRGVIHSIEKVCFVTVYRFEKQRSSLPGGMLAQIVQGILQPVQRLRARWLTLHPALHRADNRRSAEPAGHVDHLANKLSRWRANIRI